VVENFESYATTGAMNYPSWANWEDWSGQHSSGWQNYSIDGTVVHSGSKSLKWIYDFDTAPQTADDKAGLVLTLGTPKDLKNYGKFRLWLNRVSGNSLENYIAVKFHYAGDIISDDRAAAQAYILDSAGSTQTPTGWSEWVIDLKNDLAFKSPTTRSVDDLKNIGKIVVYGCSEMQFMGGHGTIYFDDMKLESKCSSPGSDFNGDCKVNFKDLSIFAQNWLGGK
jgi:hypothetical protein